ncbi:MAG: hypothetical protein JXA54_10060 [Candidatus Heimdallarchaeota archaeon]|nr:hypothetical protein [Candidatus Heimdallarchaeota archaeon]
MGISYRYAKNIAKLGAKLLIALLVIDMAYALVRFIIFKTAFSVDFPAAFLPIESIITNSIFTSFIGILAAGIMMFGIYYFRYSKLGIISAILLFFECGIKIAFISYQFTILFGNLDPNYIAFLSEIFELSASLLFIFTFIFFNIFWRQLKRKVNIGLGQGFVPYLFGFFALAYPLVNILNLTGNTFLNLSTPIIAIIHTFSFIAAIFEIIMFFDLLRRIDHMEPFPDQDENSIIDIKVVKQQISDKRKLTSSD